MTQTVALSAAFGASRTGQSIGYRILQIDGTTTYSAFTTTGVVEGPSGSGTYRANGGAAAPDAGGYAVWGLSGTDILLVPIDPSIVASVTGAVGSVTGSVGGSVASVTGNVGGNVTGSVGSVAGAVGSVTAAVTVGTINTDVISAAAVSAAAVTKVQTGLATPTNITGGTITNATNVTNGVTLANGAITAAKFATDAIDANALALSAINEIIAAMTTPPTAAAIADMVNSRGMSHVDGSADKYSIYHLIMAILNGTQAAGTWLPYTTTGTSVPALAVPISTDANAVPVVGTH